MIEINAWPQDLLDKSSGLIYNLHVFNYLKLTQFGIIWSVLIIGNIGFPHFLSFLYSFSKILKCIIPEVEVYSETLNNEYIERIYQMSYSSLSDNGMLQIYSFLIKGLYGTL